MCLYVNVLVLIIGTMALKVKQDFQNTLCLAVKFVFPFVI